VATLRGVDVFGGRGIGGYFRSRSRIGRSRKVPGSLLSWEQAGEIYDAAERALPPA
jgi:hypothetical protein